MSDDRADSHRRRVLATTAAGRVISDRGSEHLSEYLPSLVPDRPLPDSPSSRVVLDALRHAASPHHDRQTVDSAIAELQIVPMLQLADGADLLLDTETFLNHLMYQVACRDRRVNFMWTQQCTTVRAITSRRPLSGPAILETGRDDFAVLPGSRKRLLHSNVACLGPTRLLLSPLGVKASHDAGLNPPDLLRGFAGRRYQRAQDAILDANRDVWSRLTMTARKTLVLVNEDLSADIVRSHLERGIEPLSSMLLDPDARRLFLRARRGVVESADNAVLRATTDLFRLRDGSTLRSCRIQDDERHAVLAASHADAEVPLTREALIEGLATRVLYPDLVITYLALVVLPGLTAVGGASQHEYLPRIEEIVLRTHDLGVTFPAAVIARCHARAHSALIGPALLELTPQQRSAVLFLSESSDLDAFERDVMQRPIRESAGNLTYLRYLDELRAARLATAGPGL